MAGLFFNLKPGSLEFAGAIKTELGVEVPFYMVFDYSRFFLECELRDLLDVVTLIWKRLKTEGYSGAAEKWRSEIRRFFAEENVSYRLDDWCGVHLAVDEEFELNKASVISGLGGTRYQAVLVAVQASHAALDLTPPDGKSAVRTTFEAVEILFRLLFPSVPRLGAGEAKANLEPLVQRLFTSDGTARRSSTKVIASFADWVDSVHFYRHGQAEEEPSQPPLFLAVQMVSVGASYLRWLAEIDRMASVSPNP